MSNLKEEKINESKILLMMFYIEEYTVLWENSSRC
jgi:hypothetical protein